MWEKGSGDSVMARWQSSHHNVPELCSQALKKPPRKKTSQYPEGAEGSCAQTVPGRGWPGLGVTLASSFLGC